MLSPWTQVANNRSGQARATRQRLPPANDPGWRPFICLQFESRKLAQRFGWRARRSGRLTEPQRLIKMLRRQGRTGLRRLGIAASQLNIGPQTRGQAAGLGQLAGRLGQFPGLVVRLARDTSASTCIGDAARLRERQAEAQMIVRLVGLPDFDLPVAQRQGRLRFALAVVQLTAQVEHLLCILGRRGVVLA